MRYLEFKRDSSAVIKYFVILFHIISTKPVMWSIFYGILAFYFWKLWIINKIISIVHCEVSPEEHVRKCIFKLLILFCFEVPYSLDVLHGRLPHREYSIPAEYQGTFYGLWIRYLDWKETRKESYLFLLTLKYLSKDPAQSFRLFCIIILLRALHLKYPLPSFLLWSANDGGYIDDTKVLLVGVYFFDGTQGSKSFFVFPATRVRKVLKVVDLHISAYEWRVIERP